MGPTTAMGLAEDMEVEVEADMVVVEADMDAAGMEEAVDLVAAGMEEVAGMEAAMVEALVVVDSAVVMVEEALEVDTVADMVAGKFYKVSYFK